MKQRTVHLGFEIPSGEPVSVPVTHLCVTGQTQLSGKTTTLEAMVARSGLPAVAFVTKRGESSFNLLNSIVAGMKAREILPYFRHRADWQFVSDILGAILSEKLKFQRPWIMKVCRGAKTLKEVHEKVKVQLTGNKTGIRKATGLAESIYTELDEYFELLLPELARLKYSDKLDLDFNGLSIMDLSEYSTALQMLVVSSVLTDIYQHHGHIITVIPEAWEFVPNNKSSPAKSAAITLARKGAALQNFIWLDSQDLASIDTEVRRACGVWILGVQREQNEVKRVLSHIPAGVKRPKLEDVMQLERGQFFVCHGREIQKVYVQPAWMTEELAKAVAMGETKGIPENTTRPTEDQRRKYGEEARKLDAARPQGIATLIEGDKHYSLNLSDELPTVVKRSAKLLDIGDLAIGDPIVEPDNTPKQQDYGTIPAGLDYSIDMSNRYPPAINIPPRHSKARNQEMDQQERQQYEQTISELRRQVAELEKLIASWRTPDSRADLSIPFTKEEASRGPCETEPMMFGEPIPESFYDAIVDKVMARIPLNGRIEVEPKTYVLKQYQTQQVERLLAWANTLTVWQRDVIRFMEAKDARQAKADIFRAILGRDPAGGSGQSDRYKAIDELCAIGWLRADAGRVYPNLANYITAQLAPYDAPADDVQQVINQVIVSLKGKGQTNGS